MENTRIEYCQVRHDSLIIYTLNEFPAFHDNIEKIEKKYTGTVREGTKKRMQKAIDILIQKSPKHRIFNSVINKYVQFSLSFITLTISSRKIQNHQIVYKKCLKPFLRWLRETQKASYIWKAELQKRGQIHYHITLNVFIHYEALKRYWNKLQRKANFLQGFARREKHFNPNSTDVHSVYRIANVAAYLISYMTKKSKDVIKGKIWDCSNDLKIDRFTTVIDAVLDENLRNAIKRKKATKIELEHCVILKSQQPVKILPKIDSEQYKLYMKCKSNITLFQTN